MWNVMMSCGRDHVIKDWQKRGETSFHSVCIHLLDCSCENISVPCLVWWDIDTYHLHIVREAMKAHIPTPSTLHLLGDDNCNEPWNVRTASTCITAKIKKLS